MDVEFDCEHEINWLVKKLLLKQEKDELQPQASPEGKQLISV